MKKHDLIKAIGIMFLVYVVLSWIIPGGTFSGGTFTSSTTSPLGISDLFLYPAATASYQMFVLIALVILAIGGFYGVLNQTGVYPSMVKGMSKKFQGKEKVLLVISTIFFAIFSAFTNLTLPLFLIIPFVIAVLLSLNIDKIKAFLATFGAIIVGSIGSSLGFNMDGYNYVNYFFGVEIKTTILYSIILLVVAVAVLLFFILRGVKTTKVVKTTAKKGKASKKEEKVEEKIVAPLYEEEKGTGKKPTAATVLLILLFLVTMLSMFNWSAIKVELFNNIYESIMNFKIGDFAIFKNILGSMSAFGYWGNYEFIMLIVMTTLLIAWIYRVKAKDMVDAFVKGAKEMLPVAIVAVAAHILLYTVNSNQAPFFNTIVNSLVGLTKEFNFFVVAGITGIGSFIFSSFPYLLFAVYDPMTNLFGENMPIISLTMQSIYGVLSLIVPTSVMLVMGLKYLNISYKEWLKNAWKLLLALLVIISIAVIIISVVI